MRRYLSIIFAILFYAGLCGCEPTAYYPLTAPDPAVVEDELEGKWKERGSRSRDEYILIKRASPEEAYYTVEVWDSGKATYTGNAHFSRIDELLFLNVPFKDNDTGRTSYEFMKITANRNFTRFTACTIDDTTLNKLNSSEEIYERVTKSMYKPSYYGKKTRFRKVR